MASIITEDLSVDNDKILFPTMPLRLLEQSIACCLCLGIFKLYHANEIRNPFGEISVNISEDEVHIRTHMDSSLVYTFILICRNCYISNHLKFKKVLINNHNNYDIDD